MSVMTFEISAGRRGDAWLVMAAKAGHAFRALRRRAKARRDRRHLMQLPDYLLRDIGLSRMEVEAMSNWQDRSAFRRQS